MPPKIIKKTVEAQKKQAAPVDVQKKQAGLLLFCWTMTYKKHALKTCPTISNGYLFKSLCIFIFFYLFIMFKMRYP